MTNMTDEMQLLRLAKPTVGGPQPELTEERRRELLAYSASVSRRSRLGSRRLFALAAATLLSVLAAVVIVSIGGRSGDAWAAGIVKVAETAPRLLIAAPEWKVTRADEFTLNTGEMTFSDGSHQVELRWQPPVSLEDMVKDRAAESNISTTATVLGTEARVFRYSGTNDFIALWAANDHTIEVRATVSDLNSFEAILGSLRTVDVDTWLSAMPASVVNPSTRRQVVQSMLVDIPLPQGFSRTQLEQGSAVRDRYQLGAEVAGAAVCAWLNRWVAATDAGDRAGLRRAVGALATSHQWAVLLEMQGQGDYPKVVWEYADAIAADRTVTGGNGKGLPIRDTYPDALGCPRP
jgi:hypothetical protein